MRTAIIVPGMPSKEEYFDPSKPAQSNMHWFPWIQRQLILNGILTQTPELPEPYDPDYKKWCSVFNQFRVDEDADLIGWSCGAGFLVRWLSENKIKTGRVILVAPFIDPDKDEVRSGMFGSDFEIDPEISSRAREIVIFVSPEDDREILDSAKQIRDKVANVRFIELPDRGHFDFEGMKTEEFPELRDAIISR